MTSSTPQQGPTVVLVYGAFADAERAVWWERAVAVWPDFDRYTVGLARTIPLLVLSPVEGQR